MKSVLKPQLSKKKKEVKKSLSPKLSKKKEKGSLMALRRLFGPVRLYWRSLYIAHANSLKKAPGTFYLKLQVMVGGDGKTHEESTPPQ
jgi:hypothetical protein